MQEIETSFNWDTLKARIMDSSSNNTENITEEVALQILSERAARFCKTEHITKENTEEMIVFSDAGNQYAAPLHMLSEIRPISKITYLPLTASHILGVINFRGRIVAIYSLSSTKSTENISGYALIGHGNVGSIALFADNVIGTISTLQSEIKPPPISIEDKDYVTGVGSDGMIFLDLEKIYRNQNFYMA